MGHKGPLTSHRGSKPALGAPGRAGTNQGRDWARGPGNMNHVQQPGVKNRKEGNGSRNVLLLNSS